MEEKPLPMASAEHDSILRRKQMGNKKSERSRVYERLSRRKPLLVDDKALQFPRLQHIAFTILKL